MYKNRCDKTNLEDTIWCKNDRLGQMLSISDGPADGRRHWIIIRKISDIKKLVWFSMLDIPDQARKSDIQLKPMYSYLNIHF